jgi:hypothetical protein
MASDLAIRPLDPELEKQVGRICRRIGLEGWPIADASPAAASDVTFISLLNDASFALFNDYAAGLEGLSGPDAMTKTSFRNLPWWLQSVWLPIEFEPPSELASDEGDPTFLGSSVGLARELAKIKSMSSLELDAIPTSYAEMRKDYRSWVRSNDNHYDALSEEETIRWIWNALSDAAQMSIERGMPIALYP